MSHDNKLRRKEVKKLIKVTYTANSQKIENFQNPYKEENNIKIVEFMRKEEQLQHNHFHC